MAHLQVEADILNPFVSLEWEESSSLPVYMQYGQAVYLNNRIYFGGGASDNPGNDTKLYFCDLFTMDKWGVLDTPVCAFALTKFQSQLVLIGGYLGEKQTNELYVLDQDGCISKSTIPPMLMERSCAAAVGFKVYLIVAGGIIEGEPLSNVEIFDNITKQWSSVLPLPEPSCDMKSVVHNGRWYLFGCGDEQTHVYCIALKSLDITNLLQPMETVAWDSLPDVPFLGSSFAILGNRLVSIGGRASSSIHVYHQTWIHAGNLPCALTNACTIVLPTGELMVAGGQTETSSLTNRVFKGHTIILPVDLDGEFSLDSLCRMEVAAEASVLNEKISMWVHDVIPSRRTWTHLLGLLKDYNMIQQAEKIDECISQLSMTAMPLAMSQESSPDEDYDYDVAQMTDSEDLETVHRLTQDIALLTADIQKIKEENQCLTSLVVIQRQAIKSTGLHICGVEICDETTVFVTHSSQQFYWKGYGLRLNFPDGCLPLNVHHCTISIAVSISGQYQFSEEFHLVSPVFWLRTEPSTNFAKPVSLEIQHCAKKDNLAKLSFARSRCNQKQLPYTFKKLEGIFSDKSSYGIIQLNSFSGLGIVQSGCDEREYCANLYYLDGKQSSVQIDFVVTWNTEAHRKVALNHYSSKQAIEGPHSLIEFEEEKISLDIPMDGIVVDDCWKVQPLARPVVTRKQVDQFESGKLIPNCQLKAKVIPQTQVTKDLSLPVKLIGAKQPYDIFIIDFECTELQPSPLQDSRNKKYYGEAEKPNLKDLLSELLSKIAHEWENIGILLEIDDGILKNIEKSYNCDTGACFRQMLRTWLMKVSPPPTWTVIIEAIEKLGNKQLAKDLREKCS